MKTLISIIIFLIYTLPAFCQEGTRFETLSFKEALAKAKSGNKLIFMDCYTSWCGPCQFMSQTIFPKKEVGNFFNANFINVKYDMEKGEGPELQKKYDVQAYPTFFIIRPDGSVQHKIVGGFQDSDFFISLVKQGLNEETSLAYLGEKYENDNINKQELVDYLLALRYSGENQKYQEVNQKLQPVLTAQDRLRKEFWPVIEIATFDSEDFKFLARHADECKKIVDPKKVDYQIKMIYRVAIAQTIRPGAKDPLNQLKQVEKELEEISLEGKEEFYAQIELNRAILTKNKEKIISMAEKNILDSNNSNTWDIMNALNSLKSELTDKELNRILTWEKTYTSADPKMKDYYNDFFENFKALVCPQVYYYDLNYKEALKRAVMQDKQTLLVLLPNDANRVKIQKILNKEKTRKNINLNFITLDISPDSKEGKTLSQQFEINSYPAFIIINRDGTLNRKIMGIIEDNTFVKQIMSNQ